MQHKVTHIHTHTRCTHWISHEANIRLFVCFKLENSLGAQETSKKNCINPTERNPIDTSDRKSTESRASETHTTEQRNTENHEWGGGAAQQKPRRMRTENYRGEESEWGEQGVVEGEWELERAVVVLARQRWCGERRASLFTLLSFSLALLVALKTNAADATMMIGMWWSFSVSSRRYDDKCQREITHSSTRIYRSKHNTFFTSLADESYLAGAGQSAQARSWETLFRTRTI